MDRPAFDRHWGWKCAGLGGTAWVVLLGGAARGYVALGPFDQFFLYVSSTEWICSGLRAGFP